MIKDVVLFIMWFSYLSWLLGLIIHDIWELDKEIKEIDNEEEEE